MSREEKMQDTLEKYLKKQHPDETLKAFVQGTERLNFWLEILLLGPAVGSIVMKNYFIGLSEKRIIFNTLSWWNNGPTDEFSEVSLARVLRIQYKRGVLTGQLKLHYGDDIQRNITIYRIARMSQLENAEKFATEFERTPKLEISGEELQQAKQSEDQYKASKSERIAIAFVVLAVVVCLLVIMATAG
jgi:hypothetical protein